MLDIRSGGALSLSHPLGASGLSLSLTPNLLSLSLSRRSFALAGQYSLGPSGQYAFPLAGRLSASMADSFAQ